MTTRETAEVIATGIGIGIAYAFLHHSALFKERTLGEVVGYLRKLDWEEVKRLFDRDEEERVIGFWTRGDFRRAQRARLDLAGEFLERMYYDNRVLFQWGNTELKDMRKHRLDYEAETLDDILELVRTTKRFRRVAWVALWKVRLLSLLNFEKLRFIPVPSVAGLRMMGHTNLLKTFEAVIEAGAKLAMVYGEDFAEEIRSTI